MPNETPVKPLAASSPCPNEAFKHALRALSSDMQGSVGALTSTVEDMNAVKMGTEDLAQLKQHLRTQLSRLNEGMSLLGTMLETESGEILDYVLTKKR